MNSLKSIFWNMDRKRQRRTLSFPKQGMFQFVLSREMLQRHLQQGSRKRHSRPGSTSVCKSNRGWDFCKQDPHVPLPALSINESSAPHECYTFLPSPLTIQPYKRVLLTTPPVRNPSYLSLSPVWEHIFYI